MLDKIIHSTVKAPLKKPFFLGILMLLGGLTGSAGAVTWLIAETDFQPSGITANTFFAYHYRTGPGGLFNLDYYPDSGTLNISAGRVLYNTLPLQTLKALLPEEYAPLARYEKHLLMIETDDVSNIIATVGMDLATGQVQTAALAMSANYRWLLHPGAEYTIDWYDLVRQQLETADQLPGGTRIDTRARRTGMLMPVMNNISFVLGVDLAPLVLDSTYTDLLSLLSITVSERFRLRPAMLKRLLAWMEAGASVTCSGAVSGDTRLGFSGSVDIMFNTIYLGKMILYGKIGPIVSFVQNGETTAGLKTQVFYAF